MIRIALREAKINKFLVVFSSLGLSVLFAIVFVLINFNSRISESYWGRYGKEKYISLEGNNVDLFNYSLEDLFVYGRIKGLTYDTTISYNSRETVIPSYRGGICIYSVNDSIDGVPNLLRGDSFSLTEQSIWLSETLCSYLGCSIGSSILLNGKTYFVKGVFEKGDASTYYEGEVSFVIHCDARKVETIDSLFVVVTDSAQLARLAKMGNGKIFDDKEGILELYRGYNTFRIGMLCITYVLIGLLFVVFVCVIRICLFKRREFVRVLWQNGITSFKSVILLLSVFAFISLLACSFAVAWECIFNSLVISWADNILHIKIEGPNCVVHWLIGIGISFSTIVLSLPFLPKTDYNKQEERNQ